MTYVKWGVEVEGETAMYVVCVSQLQAVGTWIDGAGGH